MTTRGIRNNNPGNIRIGQSWQGLASPNTDGSFDQFITPEYGIRAIAKILQSYSSRNLNTIRLIINTWAPPNENDTTAYVNAVASSCQVDPDACLDMTNQNLLINLIKAIIMHENGSQPYADNIILAGINLAK